MFPLQSDGSFFTGVPSLQWPPLTQKSSSSLPSSSTSNVWHTPYYLSNSPSGISLGDLEQKRRIAEREQYLKENETEEQLLRQQAWNQSILAETQERKERLNDISMAEHAIKIERQNDFACVLSLEQKERSRRVLEQKVSDRYIFHLEAQEKQANQLAVIQKQETERVSRIREQLLEQQRVQAIYRKFSLPPSIPSAQNLVQQQIQQIETFTTPTISNPFSSVPSVHNLVQQQIQKIESLTNTTGNPFSVQSRVKETRSARDSRRRSQENAAFESLTKVLNERPKLNQTTILSATLKALTELRKEQALLRQEKEQLHLLAQTQQSRKRVRSLSDDDQVMQTKFRCFTPPMSLGDNNTTSKSLAVSHVSDLTSFGSFNLKPFEFLNPANMDTNLDGTSSMTPADRHKKAFNKNTTRFGFSDLTPHQPSISQTSTDSEHISLDTTVLDNVYNTLTMSK